MEAGPVRTNPGKLNPAVREPAALVDERVWTLCVLPPLDGGAASAAAVPARHRPPRRPGLLRPPPRHRRGHGDPRRLPRRPNPLSGASPPRTAPPPRWSSSATPPAATSTTSTSPTTGPDRRRSRRVGTVRRRRGQRLRPSRTGKRPEKRSAWTPARPTSAARPSDEEIAWARAVVAGDAPMSMVPGRARSRRSPPHSPSPTCGPAPPTTEVQAFAVGEDLAIVGLPGEIFAELGLDLRRPLPPHPRLRPQQRGHRLRPHPPAYEGVTSPPPALQPGSGSTW